MKLPTLSVCNSEQSSTDAVLQFTFYLFIYLLKSLQCFFLSYTELNGMCNLVKVNKRQKENNKIYILLKEFVLMVYIKYFFHTLLYS